MRWRKTCRRCCLNDEPRRNMSPISIRSGKALLHATVAGNDEARTIVLLRDDLIAQFDDKNAAEGRRCGTKRKAGGSAYGRGGHQFLRQSSRAHSAYRSGYRRARPHREFFDSTRRGPKPHRSHAWLYRSWLGSQPAPPRNSQSIACGRLKSRLDFKRLSTFPFDDCCSGRIARHSDHLALSRCQCSCPDCHRRQRAIDGRRKRSQWHRRTAKGAWCNQT